jgi:hypothetical protein
MAVERNLRRVADRLPNEPSDLEPVTDASDAVILHLWQATQIVIDHGSLYPALQRLEARGWVSAEWGTSNNNRRARFYTLTKAGRKQLVAETRQWRRLADAIGRILGPEEA